MANGHFRYRAEPAFTIIRRLGGVRALAAKLGVTPEAVSKCNRPENKGGDAGRMPPQWWKKLKPLLEETGEDWAIWHLRLKVAHGRPREKLTREEAINRYKEKGDRFERQVAKDLTKAGLEAHRVPLSGAVPGYGGDVKVPESPTGRWIIQCKVTTNKRTPSGRAPSAGGRAAIVRFLTAVSYGIVKAENGVRYHAMRQPVFEAWLRGERPEPVNTPLLEIDTGKQIADAIEGHDALVFRRDQTREWMALVQWSR